MLSIIFGGLAMLAKESGTTVFVVNLIYDLYRNWSTLKKTIQDVRWNQESYKFAKRLMSVLVSMSIFLIARLAILQGSLPKFSQQDNPAAFHSSFITRLLTFLYLSSFNLWLLICPMTWVLLLIVAIEWNEIFFLNQVITRLANGLNTSHS